MGVQLIDANGVAIDADTPLPVSQAGGLWTTTAAFTRPNDTTAYAIADAIANSTTAANVSPLVFGGMASAPGGTGLVTNVLIWKSTATITNASFRLYLLTARLTAAFADNAAFNLTYQDLPKVAGVLDFLLRTEGGSATVAYAWDDSRRIDYQCDGADTSLYGYLAAEAAYTPGGLDQFYVRLTARRDV